MHLRWPVGSQPFDTLYSYGRAVYTVPASFSIATVFIILKSFDNLLSRTVTLGLLGEGLGEGSMKYGAIWYVASIVQGEMSWNQF